jgi:hypothetical protein
MFLFLIFSILGIVGADKILQIQTVCRHGDRAPEGTYKNDPYQADFWPMGWGELTTVGMAQHFTQGTKLRQKYIDQLQLLPAKYDSKHIYVRSDDSTRTIMSAMSILAGFYSESNGTHPNIPGWPNNFSPIPVHNVEHSNDYLINAHAKCARSTFLRDAALADEKFLEYVSTLLPYLEKVAEQTGDPPTDLKSFGMAFDAIYIEKQHNLTLPDWITDDLYTKLSNLSFILVDIMNGAPNFGRKENTELIMLEGGVLLNEMIENMEKAISGSSKKYHLYSGHDTTIAAHLRTFGAKEGALGIVTPFFGSMSVVELWDGDGKPYIKLWYSDNSSVPFRDITQYIGDCGGKDKCDFEQFKVRSQPYLATYDNIVERCDKL